MWSGDLVDSLDEVTHRTHPTSLELVIHPWNASCNSARANSFAGSWARSSRTATRLRRTVGPARCGRSTSWNSTGSGMAARLAAQGGRYRLLVRGLCEGRRVDTTREIVCVGRTLDVRTDPEAVWAASLDPDLRMIVSNATEAGYRPGAGSFPAHLLDVLVTRARADMPGLTVLPCELVDRNGERLLAIVRAELAVRSLEPAVAEHVRVANTWAVTLVDRIVTPAPEADPGAAGDPSRSLPSRSRHGWWRCPARHRPTRSFPCIRPYGRSRTPARSRCARSGPQRGPHGACGTDARRSLGARARGDVR